MRGTALTPDPGRKKDVYKRQVTALLDVALLRAAAADTGVTDITQKGQTLLLSLGQRMDVPSLMAVCTLPAYRSRLLLSARCV